MVFPEAHLGLRFLNQSRLSAAKEVRQICRGDATGPKEADASTIGRGHENDGYTVGGG